MWENLVGRSAPVLALLLPAAAGDVPGGARGRRRSTTGTARSTAVAAVADPRRGRRGDLQPAHHPPLRARAGDARRLDRRWRSCRRTGTSGCGTTSASRRRTTRSACCRTCTGPCGAIGYFPTYALGNVISAQLWEKVTADDPGPARPVRAGRVRRARATGCGRTSAATGASSRRARLLERIDGRRRSTPEPYVRYLRGKYPLRDSRTPAARTNRHGRETGRPSHGEIA